MYIRYTNILFHIHIIYTYNMRKTDTLRKTVLYIYIYIYYKKIKQYICIYYIHMKWNTYMYQLHTD
jgi:hypothetical protein